MLKVPFWHYSLLLTLGLFLLLGAGCGKQTPEIQTQPQDIPGYLGLKEEFGPLDFTPLKGRHIVLDPGHGGYFRGAVGPEGLTEAEVNLGVALYLRGLLEWAGAEVHLTRSADYDFLSPADSSLSSDLAFRVNLANDLKPDVFLSIHHNSTASADPDINETQTYYPIGKESASLDLARSIHRHLVVNLEISPAKILPGNFHVLRKAEVPAVLGEPAMISNPVMEGRLSLARSHELEAQAYFLGLLDHFAAGSPRWSGAPADTVLIGSLSFTGSIAWRFESGPEDTSGILRAPSPGPDPSTFQLTLNGEPEEFQLSPDGHSVTWGPSGILPDRPSVLELVGRNLAGRRTPLRRTVLWPSDFPARSIRIYQDATGLDLVRWTIPSEVSPPNEEQSDASVGYALVPSRDDWSDQGAGHFLDEALDAFAPTHSFEISDTPARLSWRLLSLPNTRPEIVTSVPAGGWRNRFFSEDDWPYAQAGSCALAIEPHQPVWIEARGLLPLVDPVPGSAAAPRTVEATDRHWQGQYLVPDLVGAVIVLDPAGGGTLTDGTGPLGTRGADLNLETALATRYLLEGAGARVILTRTGETVPPNQNKVRLAEINQADLFLTIGRSSQPEVVTMSHHPGSKMGLKWAQASAQAVADLHPVIPITETRIDESYAYLLRHTACPALEIRLPGLYSTDREIEATSPRWAQSESRVLLLAAAVALGQDAIQHPTLNLDNVLKQLPQDQALPGAQWAMLDGNFPWHFSTEGPGTVQTTEDSLSFTTGTGQGGPGLPNLLPQHTLEIHQDQQWQLWLLDFSPGYLRPSLMLEGP